MPDLIVVVLRMGLPDDDESLAAGRFLDAVAKAFPERDIVLRHTERRQTGLKLLPAQLAMGRRVRHAERFVMHVRGCSKPVGERDVRLLMQFLNQGSGARLSRIVIHTSCLPSLATGPAASPP